ncbi:coiled-coil domain-containing protein 87 [Carassius auratus]|uniref:Coiled-coil domain-containing protein 87-like n=1 Tax=Carassius auratus TaxID=7957 RepID=A0A6P6LNP6_CARAU|nr:coiled-coil domain-containing protein 87-like [Carassius auratus]XP_026085082.1 coiled-coil domain-containing protein 87-like [Carassius auratus]XP_026085091.1 coiled-coil domain-containing protein 87-like [Carassius auratus]
MNWEKPSTHVCEHIKCKDLQMRLHSREVHSFLRPLSQLCHMDVSFDRVTDRSKEVKSAFSTYKKNKSAPTSLTQLCKQLEERITQKSQHYSISHEDRQSLTAVLTSELSLIWQDLKTPSVDTTLTQEEKVLLTCQTFSEVLHICEQLFLQSLHLLETLRRRGVFSDHINRSRVAAQLAIDCTSLLNVRSIRCRIVTGIKDARKCIQSAVTHNNERSRTATSWEKAVEDDLKEIQERIGELDLQCVYDLLPCNMEPITYKTDTQCSKANKSIILKQEQDQSPPQNRLVRIKGCHSMPDLQRETLLEELEIRLLSPPSSPLVLLSTDPTSSLEKRISPGEDLKRLLQERDYKDDGNCGTDLCSLIESLTCYSSSRLQRLKQKLQKMEEEEETKKHKVLVKKPLHPQGDVVSVTFSPQNIMRTAAAQVSDRILPETIKLSRYPPVYNDLTKEIDSASVTLMDQILVEEKMDIGKVFEELSRSISTTYFNFDEDSRIEPALTNVTFCPKRVINDQLMNPSLRRPNQYSISHRERAEKAANRKRPVNTTARAYRAWFQWWRCQLSMDDYLNYISNQDSDYLSVLFHLYDSEDDDDEEEAERHKLAQMQRDERRRRQQERISSLRRQKQEFVPGFWNINTIAMGGLGREPEMDEKNPEEEIQEASEGEEGEGPAAGLLNGEQMQVRLERVWNALCLPEGQRLDMAIKYSSHEYRNRLQEAIAAWEQAAGLIQKRELLLSRLEDFEREASDPNRFFQRGYNGSSIARMEEASQREKLNSQISVVDQELSKTMGHITTCFNDNISYKGRPYREKMRWDRTEMLYWLQQERRVQSLEMFVDGRMALPVKLPPLNQSKELHLGNHQTLQEQPQINATL